MNKKSCFSPIELTVQSVSLCRFNKTLHLSIVGRYLYLDSRRIVRAFVFRVPIDVLPVISQLPSGLR